MFKAFEADLPVQMGQTIELRDYQQEAIDNLKRMREDGKTIALLYHATGVGKTITAATDAKAVGGRTLFLVNALKLASQAKDTFAKVWPEATLGGIYRKPERCFADCYFCHGAEHFQRPGKVLAYGF
ncbi:MAG: DEAD/DEAH box helicase family protein [Escherichia coli]|nr:DEAD/DEAH box helicase family protein [Escherichia coli]MBL1043624.1 DEAD/DEAH box helicase family protein [Escherichia coli]